MEFKLLSPTENGFLKGIEFNNEELKAEIYERVKIYKTLIYSENDVKVAKTDRAKLNKLKEVIETKRKEIKNQCLAPYEDFEKKVKEIVALIDEPINMIDSQIKVYDSKKREEKKKLILDFYNANIGNLKEILPFEKIFKPTYLNVSTSMCTVESEIYKVIDKTFKDLDVIESLETEYKLQIKDVYIKSLNLGLALTEQKRLEALASTEQKRLEALQESVVSEDMKKREEEIINIDDKEIVEHEETVTIDFRVVTTKEKLNLLKEFLVSNQIKYGRVE